MTQSEPLVAARSVGVTYPGGVVALRDVSFSLRRGEFVAIVGPSGCGKSTLLRIVAGLIEPTAGTLTVAGASAMHARRTQHDVAFVFQDATLLPWRTVTANVGLPLELHGVRRATAAPRVRDVIDLVGLADFAGAYPGQLSGGMRMRASLARALVTRPDLMLLDEPFAALDDITRQRLNEELLALWTRDRWTALFVTHNVSEAVFLSERVLIMSARPGHLVAEVAVPFAGPRSPALRAAPEFAKLVGEVSDRLRELAA